MSASPSRQPPDARAFQSGCSPIIRSRTYSRYVERSFDWPGADHPDWRVVDSSMSPPNILKDWVLIATGDQDMQMIAKNHALLSAAFSRGDGPTEHHPGGIYDQAPDLSAAPPNSA